MDEPTPDDPRASTLETPETLLDAFRAHPEWTERERDDHLDRVIAAIPSERLSSAILARLDDLSGGEGEAILRLIEAHSTPELLRALADALVAQPDLPPERSWEALVLLEGAGLLEDYPELEERREELEESLDDESSLDQLAEQLEGDPEGTWLALQGLGAVEAEVRPQIVAGLARVPLGPGLIGFLRLLVFAHDASTRAAALDALSRPERDPDLVAAWASLASDHPDPDVVAQANRWLGTSEGTALATSAGRSLVEPRQLRSRVTALDGQGRGSIIISSTRDDTHATAAFLCDMQDGVREVLGQTDDDPGHAEATFRDFAGQDDLEAVEDVTELALRLLGGSVQLCGPETSPALRYWLEEAVHPRFRPLPFPEPFPGWDPASLPFDTMPDRALAVLDACPGWIDASPLTYEIAEEITLREGDSPPDPRRDAGAYRFLFEHRLLNQLELYRRMLYWMASFWQASGAHELGRSAYALAWQLSDAQHAVPGHPFTVALATRSLTAAQADLRLGIDPRRGIAAPGA